jgi:CheY-like chemotaxis protein
MPVTFASFTLLLFLASFGGLLYLLLRRHRPGLLLQPVSSRPADVFQSALKPPGATFSSAPRPASAQPFPPQAHGELLLLVEDDASVREMLNTVLVNHGYAVVTARDGVEGLNYFREHHAGVALVITDINMPKSNGRSFADLLRPIRPDMRILFMSGLDCNDHGPDSAANRSTDPFLLKPFKPTALLNTIHGMLHPAAPRT